MEEGGEGQRVVDASTPASGGSVVGEPCFTTDVGHSAELYHSCTRINRASFVIYISCRNIYNRKFKNRRFEKYIYIYIPKILKECCFFEVSKWKDKFFETDFRKKKDTKLYRVD